MLGACPRRAGRTQAATVDARWSARFDDRLLLHSPNSMSPRVVPILPIVHARRVSTPIPGGITNIRFYNCRCLSIDYVYCVNANASIHFQLGVVLKEQSCLASFA